MKPSAPLWILVSFACLVGTLQADEQVRTCSREQADIGEPPIRLTFRGPVDGSERIVISQAGAHWQNVHWGLSKARVTLNGVEWHPHKTPFLRNAGTATFLPTDVDFSTAQLESGWSGRDTVAISPARDAVTVRIADNPNGAGDYEFTLLLRRGKPSTHLLIQARIEGSDDVVISRDGAQWHQRHWGWPRGTVTMNGAPWRPQDDPWLANWGDSHFLADGVDFATARLVHVAGRDLATIEKGADQLTVRFADTPCGAADYLVLIRFDAP